MGVGVGGQKNQGVGYLCPSMSILYLNPILPLCLGAFVLSPFLLFPLCVESLLVLPQRPLPSLRLCGEIPSGRVGGFSSTNSNIFT